MSSEDNFDDKPLADVDAQAVAKALNSDHVFERSSAPPTMVQPLTSSTDEFPDEPEPLLEPLPEPEPLDADVVDPEDSQSASLKDAALGAGSSYGHSDPASLAAAGSGELQAPDLVAQAPHSLPEATLSLVPSEKPTAPKNSSEPTPASTVLPDGMVLQPHLAHLAQVGLVDSDTWDEQFKPRIEHLQEQITEVNDRLDHLTTRKYR